MDREKDIGLICDLYSEKDETHIVSKNEVLNINDDRINDIENSIRASLINHNDNSFIVYMCNNKIIIYFKFALLIMSFGLLVFGVYFLINIKY
jgi:hypothetical protein